METIVIGGLAFVVGMVILISGIVLVVGLIAAYFQETMTTVLVMLTGIVLILAALALGDDLTAGLIFMVMLVMALLYSRNTSED